jgi:hypothetical protein
VGRLDHSWSARFRACPRGVKAPTGVPDFRAGELAYKSDFADKQGCERAGQDA